MLVVQYIFTDRVQHTKGQMLLVAVLCSVNPSKYLNQSCDNFYLNTEFCTTVDQYIPVLVILHVYSIVFCKVRVGYMNTYIGNYLHVYMVVL